MKLISKVWVMCFRILCIAVSAAIIISVSGCMESSEFEDSNGADPSLKVITLDDMLSGKAGSSALMSATQKSGSGSGVQGILRDVDVEKITYTCKKFDGVRTIHASMPASNRMQLTITARVTSGNFEVIITVDGEYYCHVPTGTVQTIELENVEGKLVEVRIGGESAAISVAVIRDFLSD